MSNRVVLPHKAAKEDITIYYHPTLTLWTPDVGRPLTLEVYGKTGMRSGEQTWATDLIDVREGQIGFMKQRELRTFIASIRASLEETLPDTRIREITQDVINYAR
jgi:hypothetical protein